VRVPAHQPADLREARALGELQLDTTYVRLDRDADGLARVFVDDTVVWMDGAFDYVQLFTGDPLPDVARRALAVEPMTCRPNAFRTGEGLLRLEPGERFVARWGIQPG
jgi:aldose 1-epimerase